MPKLPKLGIWSSWDDRQRETAVRLAGLVLAVLAVYTFFSCVSYLFTWKADQSLLTAPDSLSPSTPVHNGSGKLGFRLGRFLICDCFGLGSFALIVILAAASARLLLGKWKHSLLKTTAVVLSGAFVLSLILSWTAGLFGPDTAFGGGLGGRCGAFLTAWGNNLFGRLLTLCFILLLTLGWLLLFSPRVSEWFAKMGPRKEEMEEEPQKQWAESVVERTRKPAPAPTPAPAPATAAPRPARVMAESAPKSTPAAPAQDGPVSEMEVIRDDDGLSTDVKEPLPRINMRDELPRYKMLPLDLLETHSSGKQDVSTEELVRNNNKIRASLANYKIQVEDVKAVVGPTVTLYKVYPAPGVKISSIKMLQDDIAMSLNAKGVRIVTLSDSVGIEVANDKPSIVPLRALLNDPAFTESKAELPVAIGYTITQKVKVFDLADAPHLLIAGATKQGKSVGLNVLVSSLLYSKHPSELKMVFIDPKMVEFSAYAGLLKHYLAVLPDAGDEQDERSNAIVKKAKDAERVLRSLCIEMDERYELLSKALVNNIKLYNEKYKDRHLLPTEGHRYLPYLVTIVDEYADLTMSIGGSPETKAAAKSIQNSIIRLAQKGRAAGIHVVLATQRPSVDVISGIIKTNFPTRIAFRVASRIDSMTILDMPGAEKLIGRGDMLYYAGVETERIQCGFVSNKEINDIAGYIGEQQGYQKCYNTPYYLPDPAPAEGEGGGMIDASELDERFVEAAKMVVMTQKGSTSDLQRRLGMGYAKAGRVMDQLENAGIVGPQEGSKPRQVLVQDLDTLQQMLNELMK